MSLHVVNKILAPGGSEISHQLLPMPHLSFVMCTGLEKLVLK